MRAIVGIASATLLVACGGPSAEERAAANAARPSAAIVLVALQPEDLMTPGGELRCSFTRADGAVVMLAAADVDDGARASAVARNARGAVPLASDTTGGFSALERGAALSGGGISVAVAPDVEGETGTEERRFSATLTATSRDGASRSFPGRWTCGP